MPTQKFGTGEFITAVTHLSADGPAHFGETHVGPLVIGHYGIDGGGEVFIEQEGKRISIPADHFVQILRELKRAHGLAGETSAV